MPAVGHRITTKDQAVAQRYGLAVPRLGAYAPATVAPLRHSYQPLGSTPAQLNDRIHSAQDGTDDATVEGAAVSVVGNSGLLNLVPKHSTWVTPTTYPTQLRTDAGGNTNILDTSGVLCIATAGGSIFVQISKTSVVVVSGSINAQISAGTVQVADASGGGVSMVQGEGLHVFNASGKDCYIQYSALTRNMAIRTVSVCDGGVTKSMDIIASAPY